MKIDEDAIYNAIVALEPLWDKKPLDSVEVENLTDYIRNELEMLNQNITRQEYKENKTGGLVTADVTVYRLEEGSTRHNDCEYPLEALEGK